MDNFKNILFINYGGIGDEILFLPTIASVKKQFPNAKITLALEPRSKSIKNLTNMIDDVILVDIKQGNVKKYFNVLKFIISLWFKKFDCVISSGKSPLVALILFLSGIKTKIGYKSKLSFLLTFAPKLNENQYAAKMYHDLVKPIVENEYENPFIEIIGDFQLDNRLKVGEYIVLHPGVSKMSINKNIFKCPKLSFWIDLIKGILAKQKQLVLLGTKDDEDLINEILKCEEISKNPNFINYLNKTKNIMEMAFIMKKSNCVICVDSAPLHTAVCVRSKIFAIFGPTNNLKLLPDDDNVTLITNNIECRPCLWHKRSFNCANSKCLDINPNLILDKI